MEQNDESLGPLGALVDQGCADISQQGVFPHYEITIASADLAQLEEEFLARIEREALGLDIHPYHRLRLRYRNE